VLGEEKQKTMKTTVVGSQRPPRCN